MREEGNRPDAMAERRGALPSRRVAVIGAGIVGVSAALYLQRDGHEVTILDPQAPGEGCSFGNAGVLSFGRCTPLGMPGLFLQVPRMLLDPLSPLAVRWRYLPRLAPWLWRFVKASTPKRVEEISLAMQGLLRIAPDAFDTLLKHAGAEDLVRRTGLLYVYESERGFAGDAAERKIWERRGIRVKPLSGAEVREMEPALAPIFRRGVHMPDEGFVLNPLRLTQTFARRFVADGGVILAQEVRRAMRSAEGIWRLETDQGAIETELVVVCAGAFSGKLAAQLGAPVPLDTERGYHVMLPKPQIDLRIPVLWGERRFVASPMDHGLRFAGTVEFGGLEAPPDYARAEILLSHGRRMLPGLKEDGATRWMGHRPSMPDSMPAIGRSPRHDSAYFAFGHGHLGLTLGPATGKLIADLIAGRPSEVDLLPFRPHRF